MTFCKILFKKNFKTETVVDKKNFITETVVDPTSIYTLFFN